MTFITEHRKEYNAWYHARERCYNPLDYSYNSYGGRGITMCSEWGAFEQFFDDMGAAPSKVHSLERKNNDLGYNKDNCIWILRCHQHYNRRSTALSPMAARVIRRLHETGMRNADIMPIFEVSNTTISNVVHNKAWVDDETTD